MEEWKTIEDFEDYEVSNYGNVRNKITKCLIIGDINNFGYYRVRLHKNKKTKRFFRHRLVALYFLPNPNNYKFVNHIDGDKSNNTIHNLEWCSQSENEKHAFRTGLKRKTNKPFYVEYSDERGRKRYEDQYKFAEEIGVCQQAVSRWISGSLIRQSQS